MNSFVSHAKAAALRKPCAIRRCAELAPFGRMFCNRHDAMAPVELTEVIVTVNRDFIAAASDNDISGAMKALELGLMTERKIRLAIEAKEAKARDGGAA